jgi:hypothetical protein
MRTFRQKMVDQRNIEPVGVGVDLIPHAADHVAGNEAVGHRSHPATWR